MSSFFPDTITSWNNVNTDFFLIIFHHSVFLKTYFVFESSKENVVLVYMIL